MTEFIKLDDRDLEVLGYSSPVCTYCRHRRGLHQCDAFEKIPEDIWFARHDHLTPYPGDGGILFEPREPAGARGGGSAG